VYRDQYATAWTRPPSAGSSNACAHHRRRRAATTPPGDGSCPPRRRPCWPATSSMSTARSPSSACTCSPSSKWAAATCTSHRLRHRTGRRRHHHLQDPTARPATVDISVIPPFCRTRSLPVPSTLLPRKKFSRRRRGPAARPVSSGSAAT
jgi:hypothetical protein